METEKIIETVSSMPLEHLALLVALGCLCLAVFAIYVVNKHAAPKKTRRK